MVLLKNRHIFSLPFIQRARIRFVHCYPHVVLGLIFLAILIALLAFYPTTQQPPYLVINAMVDESQPALAGGTFHVNTVRPVPLPVTGGPAETIP